MRINGKSKISTGSCLFWLLFLSLSMLGTIKIVMFGVDVDEQYAVTMAYRMACGDRMFLEMWEPHQTSGFLSAALIRLYLSLSGGVEYLVIYLRVAGVLIQFFVSLFLYDTMKRISSRDIALAASFFFYNTMPKYSQIPEFANMLLWFGTLLFLCLMRFTLSEGPGRAWLILAGVSTSLLVLSYPTSILAVVPSTVGIFCLSSRKDRFANCLFYWGSCALCGGAYLFYFLSRMPLSEFLYGLRQMTTDGSHSDTLLTKAAGFGQDLVRLAPHMLAALGAAFLLWLVMRLVLRTRCSFLLCLLLGTLLEQTYVWIFKNYYLKFPLLFYFVLLALGIARYVRGTGCGAAGNAPAYRAMFWFGSMQAVFIWIAALLASNTHIYESSEYMAAGLIVSIAYLEQEHKNGRIWWRLIVLGLLGVMLFRKGFFLYHTYGKDTVFVTRQKAVLGPLAGVYCRWSDGNSYNVSGETVLRHIPEGSRVLLVGNDSLIYLQGRYRISNFSTISTPTFDERLFLYWERFPEKYPEYILWDKEMSGMFEPEEAVRERLLTDCELLAEEERFLIYRCGNL